MINADGKLGTTATKITSVDPVKLNAALASLQERNRTLESTVAQLRKDMQTTAARQQKDFQTILVQQQREIAGLTTSLKEQTSLLEKVSAELQENRPAPQVVASN